MCGTYTQPPFSSLHLTIKNCYLMKLITENNNDSSHAGVMEDIRFSVEKAANNYDHLTKDEIEYILDVLISHADKLNINK